MVILEKQAIFKLYNDIHICQNLNIFHLYCVILFVIKYK